MRLRPMLAVLAALVMFLSGPAWAQGPAPGSEAFAQGKAALQKGDFTAALKAYATAARADRNNQDFLQHYLMTRQVIELRKALVSEKDPQEWEALARALRSFYHREKIFPEALVLDQQLHARINNGVSATMLAETQLALNQNREAIKVLSALEPAKNNAATQALLGIARAREGQKEEARKIAEAYSLPEPAGLGLVYLAARLHAASGNADKALNLLKTTFEGVPPSRLETFKAVVKECPDFAGLAASSGFAQVLQTKSKVAESNCSGGTDCGSCPMRGKCPSSQGGNP